MQPDREQLAVFAPPDRQRPQSVTAGIGRAGIDRRERIPADQLQDDEARPCGADAARADPEPVGQLLGPVSERLR